MSEAHLEEVRLVREFPHPVQRVFSAFSRSSALQRWLAPADSIDTEIVDFDFRQGGAYRVAFRLPDGARTTLSGRFVEIEENVRIVMTWSWEKPDPHAGMPSNVCFDFRPIAQGTELSLRHTRLSSTEMAARHEAGWGGSLGRLAKLLKIEHTSMKKQEVPQ